MKIKKKSHLEHVRIKIENHISKIKPKVFNELQTLPKTKWSIKTRKYQKKLDNLNKRMSDDWVDKNIIITKVKYPEITINDQVSFIYKFNLKTIRKANST